MSFIFQILNFFKQSDVNTFRTEFDYKPVCSQFTTIHYVSTNKIIHVYFSYLTYLISHVTSLNNTCGRSYKLSHSGL